MSYVSGFTGNFNPSQPVTIALSGTVSDVLSCGGLTFCGFYTPVALTGTAITFLACNTVGGTYVPVKTSGGSALSFTVAAAGYYAVDPNNFRGINFLKIVSGTTEAAARTIVCSLKGF